MSGEAVFRREVRLGIRPEIYHYSSSSIQKHLNKKVVYIPSQIEKCKILYTIRLTDGFYRGYNALMSVTTEEKSSRRKSVGLAIRRLRERLKVSQERLADMIGAEVTANTVCRWEGGKLMPYPKTRQKLAAIALDNGEVDLAAAFQVDVSFDEWLKTFETNLPNEHRLMMALGMCALYAPLFDPDDPDHPDVVARKYADFKRIAYELVGRLAEIHKDGEEIIVPPPNDHYRRFWNGVLEGSGDNAEA